MNDGLCQNDETVNLVLVNSPQIYLSKSYAKCIKPLNWQTWTGNLARSTFSYENFFFEFIFLT